MNELMALVAKWLDRARRILHRNESRFDSLLRVLEDIAEYKRQELEPKRKDQ